MLPRLYEAATPAATAVIAVHFMAGAVLLLLGPFQLLGSARTWSPRLHRYAGRTYVVAAGVAGLGGISYILAKGTVGGLPMDTGFGLYGLLMLVAAIQTLRHARSGDYTEHRAWGIRLFALAAGSWLYRMDYGFWFSLTNRLGHTEAFTGPFDRIMAYFFYIPNLLLAQLFITAQRFTAAKPVRFVAAAVLGMAAIFVALGTYFFTLYYWGPGIRTLFAS